MKDKACALGKFLAIGDISGRLGLWDVEHLRESKRLQGKGEAIRTLAFSPDGQLLISAGFDRSVFLWSMEAGEVFATLEGHINMVHAVAFSPSGDRLVSASRDQNVFLWSVDGKMASKPELLVKLRHPNGVHSVAFTSDGKTLICGDLGGTVTIHRSEPSTDLSGTDQRKLD